MNKKLLFWLQIIFLLFVPVTLMAIFPAVMAVRAYLMGAGGIYLLYVIYKHKFTWTDLGITSKNFVVSAQELIIPSVSMLIVAYILMRFVPDNLRTMLIGYDPQSIGSFALRIALYSFWSVPFQEFLFRSYLYKFALSAYQSPKSIFIVMWLVFVGAHIPFFSPMMMLIATWMGYVYINNYLRHRNILPIMLSHAIVGSLLIILRNIYLPYN